MATSNALLSWQSAAALLLLVVVFTWLGRGAPHTAPVLLACAIWASAWVGMTLGPRHGYAVATLASAASVGVGVAA